MTADEADTAFGIEVETGSRWSATLIGSNHAAAVGVQAQKQTELDQAIEARDDAEDAYDDRVAELGDLNTPSAWKIRRSRPSTRRSPTPRAFSRRPPETSSRPRPTTTPPTRRPRPRGPVPATLIPATWWPETWRPAGTVPVYRLTMEGNGQMP